MTVTIDTPPGLDAGPVGVPGAPPPCAVTVPFVVHSTATDAETPMDEHFRPDAGLELDDYVRAGDTNAVWHLIREAPRASRRRSR